MARRRRREVSILIVLISVTLFSLFLFQSRQDARALQQEVDVLQKTLTDAKTTAEQAVDQLEVEKARRKVVEEEIERLERYRARQNGEGNQTSDDNPCLTGPSASEESSIIPVLVIACNRVEYLRRTLTALLNIRLSGFPVYVSLDCGQQAVEDLMLKEFGDSVVYFKQPDLSDPIPKPGENKNYWKISRHYRWALTQIFEKLQYRRVIIVEDDLELAPDFFSYFRALAPLLDVDPSLFCISAFADNSFAGMVRDPKKLYRSDFFPGLGWMMTHSLWEEIGGDWPGGYWDDWMREPSQRKGRACIRPEISRSVTFGAKGVSGGQFFNKFLKNMELSSSVVDFEKENVMKMKKEVYDPLWKTAVLDSSLITEGQLAQLPPGQAARITYQRGNFQKTAQRFRIMEDSKAGVPRTAYQGVVEFYSGGRKIYLVEAGGPFAQ